MSSDCFLTIFFCFYNNFFGEMCFSRVNSTYFAILFGNISQRFLSHKIEGKKNSFCNEGKLIESPLIRLLGVTRYYSPSQMRLKV